MGILWLALSAFHVIPGLVLVVPLRARNVVPVAGCARLRPRDTDRSGLGVTGRQHPRIAYRLGPASAGAVGTTLAIVMACLNMVHMPFGTALGIYTLWVLLPAASEQEYRSLARAA